MKRLTKDRNNYIFAGVLGGLGNYWNIDPTWVRIGFCLLGLTGLGGLLFIAYIIMALIMPIN